MAATSEGSLIPRQSAELMLPCITKEELAGILEDYHKGHIERMDQALDVLRRGQAN